jgi:hypothetical protein
LSRTLSVERHAHIKDGAQPCRILLVVSDRQRHDQMQRCVLDHLPGCRIDVASSYFDAMARATRMETHLLVLDLSLDSALVPALKRFLARAAPLTLVHVFDDSMDSAACSTSQDDRPSFIRLKQAFEAMASRRPPSH